MKLKKDTGIRESNPREELLDEELIGRAVWECLKEGDSEGVIEVIRAYLEAVKTIRPRKNSMEMEGEIWKDGKFWLAEVPALDAMTQGATRKQALSMIKDLVFEMARSYFKDDIKKDFAATVIDYKREVIGVTVNDNKLFLALSLTRLCNFLGPKASRYLPPDEAGGPKKLQSRG